MLAERLAPWLARRGIQYGWLIVAVTFVTMLTAAGAMGVPGALILPLQKEFGWNTAEISSALAIRLMLYGLMGPFSAALIERYGVRRIVITAVLLLISGLVLSLAMTSLWQLIVLWGFVLGIGSGVTALVLGAIVSGRWFAKSRGLVLGLLTASSATGQLAFLPLAASIVDHAGWRWALVPSLMGLLAAALLIFLFMRDRPADLGQEPFGQGAKPVPVAAPVQSAIGRAFAVLFGAARVPAFWLLFGTFFICGLSTNGLIQTHFIPLCADFGMAPVMAASTLAMMGAFDLVGTIASGYLSDRFDNRWLLFWYYGLRGLSLLYLPSSTFTLYGLSLFAMFYGLDWIATVPPTVKLCGLIFKEKASVVFGWVFTAHQLGAATAAFGAGLSRSGLATYLPAFYAAGAACLIAALASLFIKKRAREILPASVSTRSQLLSSQSE
ncbi:MAG TPA: MFS transporter [Beijerinckia sp.]|jgi:sugar phosphate permease|nr:MFS transporter [Beijerinckia sp.]